MNVPLELFTFLPVVLYAETHYRFPFFFSFLYKEEPEVIFDAPHRIEPHHPIPVLLLVKDADRFPCSLPEITMTVTQGEASIFSQTLRDLPPMPAEPLTWRIFHLDLHGISGWVTLQISFSLHTPHGIRTYQSDNHRTSTQRPLRIFVSPDPLPRLPDLYLGDAHTHSNYTSDQVEFGPPMEAARLLSKAIGLSFFAVTDHSYDLDDQPDNYLVNDPEYTKWRNFLTEADRCNETDRGFVILTGEEVSCRNQHTRNVHLLLFGEQCFFSGSGDGAERGLKTWSEHSIIEILKQKSGESVAYASHPFEPVPFLQRLLLGRGEWAPADLAAEGIAGLQILNGGRDEGFFRGYAYWVQELLKGKKIFLLAGNDAHGNFNRFRQLAVPFLSLRERDTQLFGKMRTGAFIRGELSRQGLLDAFRSGRTIISDGPVVALTIVRMVHSSQRDDALSTVTLRLHAVSSSEFGKLRQIEIYLGIIGDTCEKAVPVCTSEASFSALFEIAVEASAGCYFRAVILTSPEDSFDQQEHFCYTNPIWMTASAEPISP